MLSRCTAGCVQNFRAGRGLRLLQLWELCVVTARRCALQQLQRWGATAQRSRFVWFLTGEWCWRGSRSASALAVLSG